MSLRQIPAFSIKAPDARVEGAFPSLTVKHPGFQGGEIVLHRQILRGIGHMLHRILEAGNQAEIQLMDPVSVGEPDPKMPGSAGLVVVKGKGKVDGDPEHTTAPAVTFPSASGGGRVDLMILLAWHAPSTASIIEIPFSPVD